MTWDSIFPQADKSRKSLIMATYKNLMKAAKRLTSMGYAKRLIFETLPFDTFKRVRLILPIRLTTSAWQMAAEHHKPHS